MYQNYNCIVFSTKAIIAVVDESGGLIPRQMASIVNSRTEHVICHVKTAP